MIPAPFEYLRADSVDAALAALGADPEAKLLAGGHSLLPAMRLRVARPTTLIDIGRSRICRTFARTTATSRSGRSPGTTTSPTTSCYRRRVPSCRSRPRRSAIPPCGIWGRSAARSPTATPPATSRPCCSRWTRHSSRKGPTAPGARSPPLPSSQVCSRPAWRTTRCSRRSGCRASTDGWAFVKFNRRAQDWALVGVSAVRRNGGVNVALTNMGLTPLRAAAVEEAVAGGADPAAAAARSAEGTAPPSDAFASAEYRRALSSVLVQRALREAMG